MNTVLSTAGRGGGGRAGADGRGRFDGRVFEMIAWIRAWCMRTACTRAGRVVRWWCRLLWASSFVRVVACLPSLAPDPLRYLCGGTSRGGAGETKSLNSLNSVVSRGRLSGWPVGKPQHFKTASKPLVLLERSTRCGGTRTRGHTNTIATTRRDRNYLLLPA